MVFKCQEDSFLKEFTSKVVSCEETFSVQLDKEHGFNVILDNTILFPEGGGQPCDYGTINGKPVRSVTRKADAAVHFVETDEPFEIGSEVEVILDWSRRMDHMQQHSGQHLITAIFDREYAYDTKSWWLGGETSYIELNANDVTQDQLKTVETLVNDLIFERRKVTVSITSPEEGLKFQDMRAPRGLPADHVGPVRVVNIEGIESNMCCGTHVTDLSQLQCVKLLHVERTKNKCLVHFIVGKRVLKKLDECYTRETQLNTLLKGGPTTHIDLVRKMQTSTKVTQKIFKNILKEIASIEAQKVQALEKPKYYSLHRSDGIEPDFISAFIRNAPDNVFYFLTVADGTGKGQMTLKGNESDVAVLGKEFMNILEAKGNCMGNFCQAKVNKMGALKKCEQRLREYFESLQ